MLCLEIKECIFISFVFYDFPPKPLCSTALIPSLSSLMFLPSIMELQLRMGRKRVNNRFLRITCIFILNSCFTVPQVLLILQWFLIWDKNNWNDLCDGCLPQITCEIWVLCVWKPELCCTSQWTKLSGAATHGWLGKLACGGEQGTFLNVFSQYSFTWLL